MPRPERDADPRYLLGPFDAARSLYTPTLEALRASAVTKAYLSAEREHSADQSLGLS